MTTTAWTGELAHLTDVLAEKLGLEFRPGDSARLGEALAARISATGAAGSAAYFERLSDPRQLEVELSAFADALTVGETYFFRGKDHLEALAEVVLPARIQARGEARRLRILSAGCSTGEEPYTLALLLAQRYGLSAGAGPLIDAIDLNPRSIAQAESALYSPWAMRDTLPGIRASYFRPEGRDFRLVDEVRGLVRFQQRNLQGACPELAVAGAYDVIFCRNVLIYFTPRATTELIGRLARALAPGGYLFLGHSDALRGISRDFDRCHTHETFYYRVKDRLEDSAMPPPAGAVAGSSAAGLVTPPAAREDADESWSDSVQRSAARIERLEAGQAHASGPSPAESSKPLELGGVVALIRADRHAEAVSALRALPPRDVERPEVLLLLAVALTGKGDVAVAEASCRSLLVRDALHAGAHYLLALCRDHVGDRPGATWHAQTAASLEPTFALPRFLLGRLARRDGDLVRARRSFAEALALLGGEPEERLVLYGGGFKSEALKQLCRAEMVSCGGMP